MIIECPKHEGSFDCTPFCDVCEGNQEYEDEQCSEPLPANIEIYRATFGGHAVAKCKDCNFTSVYWDCVCELNHECN